MNKYLYLGNLMSYHADILGQHFMPAAQGRQGDQYQHLDVGREDEQYNLPNVRKHHIASKEIPIIKKENITLKKEDALLLANDAGSGDLDEIILEANDLLENSPWALAMDRYLAKDLNIDLDILLDEALLENSVKKEKECPVRTPDDESFKSSDKTLTSENFPARTSEFISVIQGPELAFSTEENNFLQKNTIIHRDISRRAMPTSLHQACVARYLGKLLLRK